MWDRRTENRLNVLPTLELISKTQEARFSHLTCNTREELKYNLNLLCKRNYGILYFATHGSPGKIHLHRDKVTLTAHNSGDRRLRISALSLRDGSGKSHSFGSGLAGYALGQSAISWTIPSRGFSANGSVSVTGQSDGGPIQAVASIAH